MNRDTNQTNRPSSNCASTTHSASLRPPSVARFVPPLVLLLLSHPDMGLTESKSSSRKMRLKTVDFPRIDKDTACNTAFGEGASSLRSTGIHSQASQSSRYPPIVPPRSSSFSGGAHSNGGKASSRHQSMTDSPPAEKKGTIRSCLQWDSRSSQASTSHSSQSSRPAMPSPQGQGKYPKGTCDKCDGGHLTDDCPIYKKKRDDHPDAWRNFGKKNPLEMGKGG